MSAPLILAPGWTPEKLKAALDAKKLAAQKAQLMKSQAQGMQVPAAPPAPQSPVGIQAQQVAAAQRAGSLPGQNLSVGTVDKANMQRQDNQPYTYTTAEITGQEPPEGDPTANGDRFVPIHIGTNPDGTPRFHNVTQGAILPSLKALKSGLAAWQAAQEGAGKNSDLRAQLAPYLVGQPDLTAFLSTMNTLGGSKLQQGADKAPAVAAELAKWAGADQTDRTALAALENKLIDQVSIPKGTQFVTGQAAQTTAQAATPKPEKGKGGLNQKEIDAYNKMTQGGSALLNTLSRQEQVLKQIPDNYNHSVGASLLNRLKYAASGAVGDIALDDYQKKLDAARATMIQQVNGSVGLHRWNQGEVDSLKQMLGMGQVATKEKVLEGLNYVKSLERQAYLDAEAAHPEGATAMQGRGRPGSKDFGETSIDAIKQQGGGQDFKVQVNPKTGARRRVYSDGRIEAIQ